MMHCSEKKIIKYCLPLLLSFLTACSSIGPHILPKDRYNYNQAMSYSSNQELLLNLVRLRYDENPMALKVGSISGSASVQEGLNLGGTINFPRPGKSNGGINPSSSLSYSDNPIISYTPLDDQAFFQSFLSQLDLYDVGLLLQSSWSIPRVMRVGFQRVGKAYNAPSAARATSSHVPEYQNFIDMTYVLRRMQLANALTGFYSKNGTVEDLTLVIEKDYRLTPKERAVLRKAEIEIYQNKIVLTNYPAPHKVYVVTRSVIGVFNYLSKGVAEPPEDIKSQVMTQTVYDNGKPFDWQLVLEGMMKIYYSDKPPVGAYLAIPYRGRWYYIKDSDSDSKQTLTLLANISGLAQTTPPTTSAPALTRSV